MSSMLGTSWRVCSGSLSQRNGGDMLSPTHFPALDDGIAAP